MNLKILKLLFFTICLIFLINDCYELTKDYQNFQTVVTVNIERQSLIDYPGVSVCEVNDFVKLKQNIFNYSRIPVSKGLCSRAKRKNLQHFTNIINHPIKWKDFLKLFVGENLMIKHVFASINDGFITCTMRNTRQPCIPVDIHSGYFSQCKTFFIDISRQIKPQTYEIIDNSRDNEMAVIKITNNQTNECHTNQITVLITPTNQMPVYTIQKLSFRQNQLTFGRKYDLTFSKTKIITLPKPYKPYCSYY